jgi:hypothetical protein
MVQQYAETTKYFTREEALETCTGTYNENEVSTRRKIYKSGAVYNG